VPGARRPAAHRAVLLFRDNLPPGNPKAHYWTGGPPGADPEEWLAGAERQQGSWWEAWADWATARAGERKAPPADPGSERYPVLSPAPGLYVRDVVPG
jgi:polyhydroxyalkanoate synthase